MYNILIHFYQFYFYLNKWPQKPKMFQSGKNITGYVYFIKMIKDLSEKKVCTEWSGL